jgi:endogenous inhibitor of DNA gyrase (YacG/DUF329 family)
VTTSCPTCKRPVESLAFEPPFPFCSQRCKLADLDGWLSDRYVVSEPLPDLEPDEQALRALED